MSDHSGRVCVVIDSHLKADLLHYLGEVFGRPFPDAMPWLDDDDGADMWATADESREWVSDFYRRVGQHSEATVQATALDDVGQVPWWPPERR